MEPSEFAKGVVLIRVRDKPQREEIATGGKARELATAKTKCPGLCQAKCHFVMQDSARSG
jgi:hypothetical protein